MNGGFPMDINTLLVAASSMGGLGALFSIGLAVANKKFYVYENPKIGDLTEVLPGANCGGCGVPGCAAFATNVVNGVMDINGCPVASPEQMEEMAAILGVDASTGEKTIARIMCQGGINDTAKKANYLGGKTCASAHLGGGGDKLCSASCLGYGDCVEACPFDAMYLDERGLPVVIDEKCTGCGNCVAPCPRDLVEMHPVSSKLFVLCKNKDEALFARSVCLYACTACNQCVKNAPVEGGMTIENNLAFVDYTKMGKDAALHTDKCATNCLVIVGDDGKYYASQEEADAVKSGSTSAA